MDTSDLKEIYVVGRPRSGTVWLNRLVADALNSPLEAPGLKADKAEYHGPGRDGGYVVRKTHDGIKRGPTVFIQRDPRDVAVSTMFYRHSSDLFTVVRQMCEPYNTSYKYHIRIWLDRPQNIKSFVVFTRYETLHENTKFELRLIVEALTGKTFTHKHLAEVVERQSFSAVKSADVKGRYAHSMRKGIVGDWKNHFTKEIGQYMQQHMGDFMLEQGYITNENQWYEELS